MNTQEWITLTGYEPDDQEWEKIRTVYAFHPAISDKNGKREIASFFKLGGMGLIEDMLPISQRMKELETNLHGLRDKVRAAEEEVRKAVQLISAQRAKYKGD